MSALVSYPSDSEAQSESESEFFTLPTKDPVSEVVAAPLEEENDESPLEYPNEPYPGYNYDEDALYQPSVAYDQKEKEVSHHSTVQDESLQSIPEYAAAMRKKRPLDVVDIRQDDLVGDSWKRAMKDVDPPSNAQTNKFYYSRASEGVLRNNNIRYLAYKAIEQQRELEKKAEYRKALQKESRAKYGF
jgi:hypothetical protein